MNIQRLLYNESTTQYELLMTPISLFPILIKGSKIEKLIRETLKEVRKKKLSFKPTFYPSDEFGCVEDTMNIGIPFYIIDPELEELNQLFGSERGQVLEKHQIKATLRHECGHAFFYAFGIAKNKSAKKIFGDFSSKRTSIRNIQPNSSDYVDYLGRWGAASAGYGQTHPEEDFADTFAAWLDPLEKKSLYSGKALKKFQLIDKIGRRLAGKKPKLLSPELHKPHTAMKETLENFFQRRFGFFDLESIRQKATGFIDSHLRRVFSMNYSFEKNRSYAAPFLERNRKWLIRRAKPWVKNPFWLDHLIQKSIERAKILHLTIPGGNVQKTKKIFCASLILMNTFLEEKGRLD